MPGVVFARESGDTGEGRDAVGPREPPESLSTRGLETALVTVGSLIVLGLPSVGLLAVALLRWILLVLRCVPRFRRVPLMNVVSLLRCISLLRCKVLWRSSDKPMARILHVHG